MMKNRRTSSLFLLFIVIATRSAGAFVWGNRRSRTDHVIVRLHRRVSDTVPFVGDESSKHVNNYLQVGFDAKEEFSRAVRFDGQRSTKTKEGDKTEGHESKCPSFEWDHRDLM